MMIQKTSWILMVSSQPRRESENNQLSTSPGQKSKKVISYYEHLTKGDLNSKGTKGDEVGKGTPGSEKKPSKRQTQRAGTWRRNLPGREEHGKTQLPVARGEFPFCSSHSSILLHQLLVIIALASYSPFITFRRMLCIYFAKVTTTVTKVFFYVANAQSLSVLGLKLLRS